MRGQGRLFLGKLELCFDGVGALGEGLSSVLELGADCSAYAGGGHEQSEELG